jgi:hypothetical protein
MVVNIRNDGAEFYSGNALNLEVCRYISRISFGLAVVLTEISMILFYIHGR